MLDHVFAFELRDPPETPVCQRIAAEATQMRAAGGTVKAIRLHFGVDHHTVEKAIRWFRQRST